MASSSHLKPGETGRITARVDTTNQARGLLLKTVDVYSNDPKKQKVTLMIRVTVVEPPPTAESSTRISGQ